MRVEMRVYRQFDLDLFALASAGYSLSQLSETAVTSFANGNPVYFYMDEITDFHLGDKTSFIHFGFYVDNNDSATINLLRSVAPRMRTSFCKMILRNALGQQNLHCFFPNYPEVDRLMAIDYNKRMLASRPDTIPMSRFRVQRNIKDMGVAKVDMAVKNTSRKRQMRSSVQNGYGAANPYMAKYTASQQTPAANNTVSRAYQNIPQTIPEPVPVQQTAPQYTEYTSADVQQAQTAHGLQMPPQVLQQPQAQQTQQQVYNETASGNYQQTVPVQNDNVQIQNNDVQQNTQQAGIFRTAENNGQAPKAVDDDLLNAFDNL